MSIADLTLNKDDGIRVPFDEPNKIYVQTFKTPVNVYGTVAGGTNRALINLFPEVEIQANKSFTIDTFVKAFVTGTTGDTAWLGLSVATNIKISGIWYSLGNSGRLTAGNRGGDSLTAYVSKKYVDFNNLLNRGYVQNRVPYTVQVELVGTCHDSARIVVNHSIAANGTFGGSTSGITGPVASVSDQNFTTVIIEETA